MHVQPKQSNRLSTNSFLGIVELSTLYRMGVVNELTLSTCRGASKSRCDAFIFLPEAKPTGLVEPLSVCQSV